ncbi:hypothetical protein MCUN1_003881 [Malassezia cuniculi]|uniref:Vacuolar protein sorting-associated protein 54 C-terminal domain-containing protein n=1 Tax=Malassezia cuniculi TaxID=948313 RepID=A0AAF0J8L9_9BASI|nr:hypothetical protein MCUN1_003881 [Malassezia cuniculi]
MPTEGAAGAAGVSLTGFHAISTILNHPTKRPAPIDAHAARFPPIGPASQELSELPAVDRARVNSYVEELGPLWERYERERGTTHKEHVQPRLPPLSAVPQAFFSTDFDLGRPATFDTITERYKRHAVAGMDDASSPYDVVLNQMLQEKLSYYSDVVEQHLVSEISAKSTSFFDALDTLQRLGSETSECIERIDTLHTQLDGIDTNVVQAGLQIVQEQHQRRALEAQQELLERVKTVVEQRDLAVLLVEHGELDDAVEVLERLDKIYDDELGQISALRPLRPQLNALRESVCDLLGNECVALLESRLTDASLLARAALDLCSDKDVRCDEVLPAKGTMWHAVPAQPEYSNALRRVWSLLVRAGGTGRGVSRLNGAVGDIVSRASIKALSHTKLLANGIDASTLTAADHDEYTTALASLLRTLLFLRRVVQHDASELSALLKELGATDVSVQLDELGVISCEQSHKMATHAILPRNSRLTELDMQGFIGHFSLIWRFVQLSEAEVSRPVVSLRGAALVQAKSYLVHLHRVRIDTAMKAVEEEVWSAVPPNAQVRQDVADLLASATSDVPAYVIPQVIHATLAASPAPQSTSGERTLAIGESSYHIVHASTVILHLLGEYVRVVINVPVFSAETMGWVIEFLKQFNSRTCQVVLGAGAMRSAGLKNITARHLALASQSLSVIVALVGPLRKTIKRHLGSKQEVLLTEFDKLLRDYREHQFEIHSKLLSIMSDRVQVHARALNNTDWNAPRNGDAPQQPIVDMVRETSTLHRVLTQYMERNVTEGIFSKVYGEIDSRIGAVISRVDVKTQDAYQKLVTDNEYLREKLGSLGAIEFRGENIADALKSKRPPPRSSTERAETATPVGYRPRFSFGKRPPTTQSPRVASMEAFEGPPNTDESENAPQSDTPETERTDGAQDAPASSLPAENVSASNPSGANDTASNKSVDAQAPDVSNEQDMQDSDNSVVEKPEAEQPADEQITQPPAEAPENAPEEIAEQKPADEQPAVTSPAPAPSAQASADTPASAQVSAPAPEDAQVSAPSAASVQPPASPASAQTPPTESSPTQDVAPAAPKSPTKAPVTPREEPAPTTPRTDKTDNSTAQSTPAGQVSPTKSDKPARPGRISLQQRLAEAAKRRGRVSASPAVTPKKDTSASGTEPEKSEAAKDDAAKAPNTETPAASVSAETGPDPKSNVTAPPEVPAIGTTAQEVIALEAAVEATAQAEASVSGAQQEQKPETAPDAEPKESSAADPAAQPGAAVESEEKQEAPAEPVGPEAKLDAKEEAQTAPLAEPETKATQSEFVEPEEAQAHTEQPQPDAKEATQSAVPQPETEQPEATQAEPQHSQPEATQAEPQQSQPEAKKEAQPNAVQSEAKASKADQPLVSLETQTDEPTQTADETQ